MEWVYSYNPRASTRPLTRECVDHAVAQHSPRNDDTVFLLCYIMQDKDTDCHAPSWQNNVQLLTAEQAKAIRVTHLDHRSRLLHRNPSSLNPCHHHHRRHDHDHQMHRRRRRDLLACLDSNCYIQTSIGLYNN